MGRDSTTVIHDVTTPDDRTLRVYEAGATDGVPMIVHHGTPTSGRLYSRHVALAEAGGIRVIGYDRPGYAGSTRHEGRSIAGAADDVRAIANHFGFDRVTTWGISGGGPHALACVALLPDLVAAAASLGGVAPMDADGLDWTAGMGEENLEGFAAVRAGGAALDAYLDAHRAELLQADAEKLVAAWDTLLAPVDRAVLTGMFAEYVVESVQAALEPGNDGWRDDEIAFAKPWGFSLEAIGTPVLLWHGTHDLFVPVSHGEWLAARIQGVDARISDDDGHLTLIERRIPDVHAWLVERY
jgi:pimeloyl-ACP methyl ester carboxylesterase